MSKRSAFRTSIGGASLLVVTGATMAPAMAADPFDTIARCESGGDPTAQNPTSSASGLYQIIDGTWRAYGGRDFAPTAAQATPFQQRVVAQRIFDATGDFSAWDSSRGCWAGALPAEAPSAPAPVAEEPVVPEPVQPAPEDAQTEVIPPVTDTLSLDEIFGEDGEYEVQSGDWLSKTFGADWRAVYEENRDVIGADPALIHPNQVLVAPGGRHRAPEVVPQADIAPEEPQQDVQDDVVVQQALPPVPAPAPAPAPAPVSEPASAGSAAQVAIGIALAQKGVPYLWGGSAPGGFDCSGLVQYAYGKAGISLPRTSAFQAVSGSAVTRAQLQPGDLVAFYSPVSHIGIYIGDNQIVHAPTRGDVVKVVSLDFMPNIVAMRRVG